MAVMARAMGATLTGGTKIAWQKLKSLCSFLNHYSAAHATARDLTRLDGTQDNNYKQVWGPHVRT